MCWEVENCSLTIRYRCPAFILRRPCWELWAVEGVGPARACCHNEIDCEPGRCVIAEKRFAASAEPLTVHVGRRGMAIASTFTHLAHHRGQLTVYLRLNDAKVPSVYGPSADDRTF